MVRKLLNNGVGSFSLKNLYLRKISNTTSLFNEAVVWDISLNDLFLSWDSISVLFKTFMYFCCNKGYGIFHCYQKHYCYYKRKLLIFWWNNFFSVFLFLCIFFVCNYVIVIFFIRKNWNFVEFSLILLMRYFIILLVHFKVTNSSFYEDNFYKFLYIIFKSGCHWL